MEIANFPNLNPRQENKTSRKPNLQVNQNENPTGHCQMTNRDKKYITGNHSRKRDTKCIRIVAISLCKLKPETYLDDSVYIIISLK